MVRVRVLHAGAVAVVAGWSMIEPLPRQSVHGSENPNAPWLRLMTPAPLQVGHTRGLVPGRRRCRDSWCTAPGWSAAAASSTPLAASTEVECRSRSRRRCRAADAAGSRHRRPRHGRTGRRTGRRGRRRRLRRRAEQVAEVELGAATGPNPPNAAWLRIHRRRTRRRREQRDGSRRTPCAWPGRTARRWPRETALNRSSAAASPGFASGCRSRASLR